MKYVETSCEEEVFSMYYNWDINTLEAYDCDKFAVELWVAKGYDKAYITKEEAVRLTREWLRHNTVYVIKRGEDTWLVPTHES